jgi:hypothetical protein
VPSHYLARFAGTDGRLWQYMRGAADPQRVHPSNAAVGKHLYSLEAGGVPVDDSIEVWLADNVDGPAATLIPKLIARRTLKGHDRARFSLFLALQEVRIPRFRDLVDETLAGIGRQILQARAEHDPEGLRELFASKGVELSDEAFAAEMKQYRGGEASIRPSKAWWLNSLEVANQSAPLIAARAWKVIEAPHPVEFVTSDAPVVRVLTRNVPEARRSLWRGRYLEGTFPLDPKHLLLIRSPGRARWDEGMIRWCTNINERTVRQAHRFVFTRRRTRLVGQVWDEDVGAPRKGDRHG